MLRGISWVYGDKVGLLEFLRPFASIGSAYLNNNGQRTEVVLRHTNNTLQALVTASPRAIVMLDRVGLVKIWNPAAEEMFGWTEAEPIDSGGPQILYVNQAFTAVTGYQSHEVLGKTLRILQWPKTDRSELDKVRIALSKWESITVEVINYRKDGSEFWNEFSLVPVADDRGFYTHWIAVQRDTTRRKQLDEIRLALEREQELSSLKTRFFQWHLTNFGLHSVLHSQPLNY